MKHPKQLTIAIGILVTGALFGPASFAQSTHSATQQFRQMDTNHDGQVSKSEFNSYWKQQFQTADTNHDGKLSRHECEVAVRNMEGSHFSQAKFDRMWKNVSRNGHISPNKDLAFHDKQFRKADSNGNGKLSLAEVHRAMRSSSENLASL